MGFAPKFSARSDRLLRAALLATLLVLLAAGGRHFGSLACVSSAGPAIVAATASPASPAPAERPKSAWPRAALRLWLLVPQILPSHDR
jgi:hypothetical protein